MNMTETLHALRRLAALVAAACLLLPAGCFGPRPVLPPSTVSAPEEPLEYQPAPETPARPAASLPSPRLKPGFRLDIRVLVSGDVEVDLANKRIRNDGTLVLPLLGAVEVAGATTDELAAILKGMYNKRYYVDPQVEVEFALGEAGAVSPWGTVTVLGRVKSPGPVNIPPTRDLTVSRAIHEAGGLATSAKSSSIRVSRKQPGDDPAHFLVNMDRIGVKGQHEQDLVLRAGDIVFVPESVF